MAIPLRAEVELGVWKSKRCYLNKTLSDIVFERMSTLGQDTFARTQPIVKPLMGVPGGKSFTCR